MPPRKKAADGATTVPTRSSARTRALQAAAVAATPTPPTPPTPAQAKPNSKRPRANSADAPDCEPVNKKGKKGKAKEDDSEETEAEGTQKGADTVPDESKKMVTILKRGAAPVDPLSGRIDTHMVYTDGTMVWDAMLNQTDVSGSQNKNKFYVLQLLHPNQNSAQCFLYTRWGRVGENGQNQMKGPWAPQVAIGEFKKQFRSKTAVSWEDRVGMVAKKGKYTWIERDYSDDDNSKDVEKTENKETVAVPDSELEGEIQELCKLIFSTSLIDAHLSSMNYDAKKLPLGKLAKSTILSGFAALKALSEAIEKPNGDIVNQYGGFRAACAQLSSVYYSIIPHDFGRQRPKVIDNHQALQEELNLVDALGDMEIASKLISTNLHTDANGAPINPLDANFRSLGLTSMKPVKRDTQEFKTLEGYVRDTHGATHEYLRVSVLNAYRVERAAELEAWNRRKFGDLNGGQRLLLWHGSRTTNFAGILKQGLRIAPPEAPVTGYMFGKGVYFADMMSKSANYCYSYLSNSTGLLLLCEVAVKPLHELINASYNADQECKSNNKMATKGIGRTQPADWKDAGVALNNEELIGCQMPAGPGKVEDGSRNVALQYNEYIVYDTSQIRMKYLLMVRM